MPGAIWWLLVLMMFIVAGFVAVAHVKKWLNKDDDGPSPGFSLSDLRALHKSGKLSTEEFEKTKTLIVEAAKRAAEREAQAKKPENRPPGTGRLTN
jgi:uncharacterized membrane protein